MKKIFNVIKKPIAWLRRKSIPMILVTELVVIILTVAFTNILYAVHSESVCNSEQLRADFGFMDYDRYMWNYSLSRTQNVSDTEKVLNERTLICTDKEKNGGSKKLPYGIYIERYSNGELVEESDDVNTDYNYDSKAYELARKHSHGRNADWGWRCDYTDVYTRVLKSGIIPERYFIYGIDVCRENTRWFPYPSAEENDVKMKVTICIDIMQYIFMNTSFVAEVIVIFVILQLVGILVIKNSKLEAKGTKNEADRSKDLFVNAVAHEMKTPAAVIINSMECIREGIRPDKKEKYRNNISKEAKHINKLVDSMMTYTEVIDENYVPNKREVVVSDIVKAAINRFEILAEQKKAKISFTQKGEMIFDGDEQLISTVVDNYISNAIKHCREDGNIMVTVGENSFGVFNEGEQIAEDELEKIWEPLYKVDKARKESGDSSGMGLAICAEVLKLHDLKYSAQNTEGGVEFKFTK